MYQLLVPDYFANNFVQRADIHKRNIRSFNQIFLTGQRFFIYRGTKLRNSDKCPEVF